VDRTGLGEAAAGTKGVEVQAIWKRVNVLRALMIRDLMMRFGRNNLGFLWTVLEPMILTAGVMTVWSVIKEPIVHGVAVTSFVLTGYMPLTLWRHLNSPFTRLISRNASLLYHYPLSHGDIVASRIFLEFLSTSAALTLIYFIVVSTGIVEPIQDPELALTAWILTGWFFGSLGLLITAWTESWNPAEKFIQPLQYLALPISGIFFMVDWLPTSAQKALLINPSVHCFEMFRAGFFGERVETHYDPLYLLAWCIPLTVLGCYALYRVRNRIESV